MSEAAVVTPSYCPLTPQAVEYSQRQLLARAGLVAGAMPVQVVYGEGNATLRGPLIVVEPCKPDSGRSLLERRENSLRWIPAQETVPPGGRLPFDAPVPVLFPGASMRGTQAPFAELRPGRVLVIHADIIAATFFMLSRWEEVARPVRDQHGRFPGAASVACRQGFLDRPVVDEYGLILQEWLKVLLPGWEPQRPQFTVQLSHDVDAVRRFPNWLAAVRAMGGEVLRRHNLTQAWRLAIEEVPERVGPVSRTPRFRAIGSLAEISRRMGNGGDAFYFMATRPGALESDYSASWPAMRRCMRELRDQGFEVGLHPGYHTLGDVQRLAEEKARLEAILDAPVLGGRQHYLRFRVPDTWRHWEQVGLVYDSSMAYPDLEGFRCGTCHPFRPFDAKLNRQLTIWELPLIVMDRTLRHYRGLAPKQGKARILQLAQRCKDVSGVFTILWHNSSLVGEWEPWAEVYRDVVAALARMRGGLHPRGSEAPRPWRCRP